MTPFLQSAGWALIHFLWQGTAIAIVASVALRLLERRSASLRYVVACVGLVAMLAAPAATARLLWRQSPTLADTSRVDDVRSKGRATTAASLAVTLGPAALEPRRPARVPSDLWLGAARPLGRVSLGDVDRFVPGITIAWLLCVAVLLGRMTGGWWHVRRLHRIALATSSSRWQTACRRLAYRLGLPAAAHVVESTLVDVPTVVGWLRPAILLPVAALAVLTPAQVEAILAHELAHIRRHDYAVNVLQTIAETLLFYHPAVWWLSARIRTEREHCCDDVAVAICGDPVSYAQALAELETSRVATLAIAATGGSLINRVRRILRMPLTDEPRSPGWAVTFALTIIFTAGAGSVQHMPWIRTQGDARAGASALQQITTDPALSAEDRMRAHEQDVQAQEAQER